MLIQFAVENYRSLRDEQVLSFEASLPNEPGQEYARSISGYSKALLPVAAVYGGNASGKTNVLNALLYMREAVLSSYRRWEPDEALPSFPFAWGEAKDKPSLFEITLMLEGVRYEYGFEATSAAFTEEWLFAWPNGRKQTWFEREEHEIKFGEHLKGRNELIQEVTRPNSLFLSAAAQLNHEQLLPLYSWFRELQALNLRSISGFTYSDYFPYGASGPWTELLFAPPRESADHPVAEALRERFRALLKSADIGITDVKVEVTEVEKTRRRRIYLKHQAAQDDAWLPLEQESQGTQTLFKMVMPILQVLETGGLLVVDELESSLHPALACEIVKRFNDPATNPMTAQLLFTTHDTNLLGTTLGRPALRRDQVWLTEKNAEGATRLYPLTDYMPRKAENMERGYLQGRYGGVPFLGGFELGAE